MKQIHYEYGNIFFQRSKDILEAKVGLDLHGIRSF